MAEGSPKHYNEKLVREVVRKTKTDLAESIDPDRILDKMYSESVTNTAQHDRLKTYRKNEGPIYATEQFLEMVMKEEVQASGFMKILSEQLPKMEQQIQKGVKRFASGEWKVPGQIDIEGNILLFDIN